MKWLVLTVGLVASLAHAQQSCVNSIRVDGTITDPTDAVIPGVKVRATKGEHYDGYSRPLCVAVHCGNLHHPHGTG